MLFFLSESTDDSKGSTAEGLRHRKAGNVERKKERERQRMGERERERMGERERETMLMSQRKGAEHCTELTVRVQQKKSVS